MRYTPMNDSQEMPPSYWAATAPPIKPVESFEGDQRADVAVIGAGFTGLSTALHLAERDVDVLVVDANEPGWGASGRNNGQVVAALKHEPHEVEATFGVDRGGRLIEAIGGGPDLVFGIIDRYGIECAAQRKGIITAAHSGKALASLQKRTDVWLARGAPLRMLSEAQVHERIGSTYYHGACLDPRGGAINPLAYARGLAASAIARGARIYRDGLVQGLERCGDRWRLKLANGSVLADKVVIGTNAYTGNFWPGLKKTFVPTRTPQLVSAPLTPDLHQRILPGGEVMSDTRALTFGVRMHPDGRLHLGGGGGTSGADRESPFKSMQRLCRQVFPFLKGLAWDFRWTGFMAMTPDRYPRLFELAPGVVAALGYSGRGIATATLLGRELAEWAGDGSGIDDLALPRSSYRELPYYPIKEIAVEAAIIYYAARDRWAHLSGSRPKRFE